MLRTASKQVLLSPHVKQRSERTRTVCGEGRTSLADTVRKREAKLGLKELFNVRSADILCLLNLHDAKNLYEEI